MTTTITDDDATPTGIVLSASPNSVGEDDAATSVTITATLQGDSTRTTPTVVTIGTLAGTATKDTDYTVTTLASITIAANATSGHRLHHRHADGRRGGGGRRDDRDPGDDDDAGGPDGQFGHGDVDGRRQEHDDAG